MAKQKFAFTHGTITRTCKEFFTLVLFNGENQVYTATIDDVEACTYIMKYKNIKLISPFAQAINSL